jgi:hypothetical protein
MVSGKNDSIWIIAKKGFLIFFLMSLSINLFNIAGGMFFSPGFSKFYIAICFFPLTVLNKLHHLKDIQIILIMSSIIPFTDGLIGVLLNLAITKILKREGTTIILMGLYLIYWTIVVFAFRISF